eukprot:scaffold30629_cov66-Skeletonema_marinoi.AAC.1
MASKGRSGEKEKVRVQVCHGVWNTSTEQATSILSRRLAKRWSGSDEAWDLHYSVFTSVSSGPCAHRFYC